MSVPEPPQPLDNSCTVVFDNTLYSYSPAAFLSLKLDEGAEWNTLDGGVVVTGGSCVGSNDGFFVVGGVSENAEYKGLQKYTYATNEWTTISGIAEDLHNRKGHGATFIKADNVIMVYGGANNDNDVSGSSQTFSVSAVEPYAMRGFDGTAPIGLAPTLLDWSDADALLIGADSKAWLFNPNAGWRFFGANLKDPLKDTSLMRSLLVTGNDGSKNLMTFDMTASPNQVSRIVLQDAAGTPTVDAVAIVRRDLELTDWPEYDAKLAPTETRSNYAMAQGPDGMIVFSGGNREHPIRIFNFIQNSWVDEVSILDEQKPLERTSAKPSTAAASTSIASTTSEPTTTATTTSSASSETISSFSTDSTASLTSSILSSVETSASTASETGIPAAAGSNTKDDGLSSGAILGITLGSIVAFLALLGLLLICLRRRKQHEKHAETGPSSAAGMYPPEKQEMDFARDLQPPSGAGFRGHRPTASQESFSSVAILMGRLGQPKSAGLTRKASNDTNRSSIASLHKQFKNTISKPIPQTQNYDDRGVAFAANVAEPRPRNGPLPAEDGMRRSSGWNKYWSGGSALQLLGFGGPPQNQRNTVASDQSSRYSQAHAPPNPTSRRTQDSATVPPLTFPEGHAGISRVNSGSPIVSQYSGAERLKEEMAGTIERPISRGSSGYSSGIPESVAEAWDPSNTEKGWGANRAPSSAYAPSLYYNTPLTPSASNAKHPPSGVSTQPQLAMASKSSDMSWLNLGEQRRL